MPVSLSCPSCRAAVEATDADRGQSVRCDTCWAEVPVPAVASPPPARLVSARPVATKAAAPSLPPEPEDAFEIIDESPTDLEDEPQADTRTELTPPAAAEPPAFDMTPPAAELVAKPPPAAPVAKVVAAAPVAKAVVAAPVARAIPAAKVAPVAKLEPARPRPAPKAKPAYDEDEDENEPDDRPRRREEPKKKGNTLLIVGGVAGVFLLFACGGVGYYLYTTYQAAQDIVQNLKTTPTEPDGPARNGDDPPPGPARPAWARTWGEVGGHGLVVRMPTPAPHFPAAVTVDGERVRGGQRESEEGFVTYKAQYYDLPTELGLSADGFVAKVPDLVSGRLLTTQPVMVSGDSGTEWKRVTLAGEQETLRAVKVGCRVFLFSVKYSDQLARRNAGLNPEAKAGEFLGSVGIKFDPNTPAPPTTKKSQGGTTTPPVEPIRPVGPPTTPPAPPSPGAYQVVAQIQPFLTAVLLADRQELLTFAPRGPSGGGVVRRVSTTTYKTLGEKFLPNAVAHAAVDVDNARLYVGTVKVPLIGPDGVNALTAVGDIVAYDLNAVLGDAELKPLATAADGLKVAGLELTPKGQVLYAATVAFDPRAKKATPKMVVVKYNASTLKPLGEVDLPQPIGVLRLSADGRQLLAAEYPYNFAGYPQPGSTAAGTVHRIDIAAWRKGATVEVPATVTDVRFLDDGKALVVMSSGMRHAKVATLDAKGEVTDVTPDGLRVRGGFAAVGPNGRVVLSGRLFPGADVLGYANGQLAPVAKHNAAEGPVLVAPGGKVAFHGSGAVLDLVGGN